MYFVPSTIIESPDGLVCTVTCTGNCVKLPVSVIAPPIITFTGLLGPVYDPLPLPLHPLKLYPNPLFAVALIVTVSPLLRQLLTGLTVPPVPEFIVK
jgi:hypothetical protein